MPAAESDVTSRILPKFYKRSCSPWSTRPGAASKPSSSGPSDETHEATKHLVRHRCRDCVGTHLGRSEQDRIVADASEGPASLPGRGRGHRCAVIAIVPMIAPEENEVIG